MDLPENTANEAAKWIQTLTFAALIVIFSAYTLLPKSLQSMSEYQSAHQLSAWLAVNNLALALTSRGKFASDFNLNWSLMGNCEENNPKSDGNHSLETATCFDRVCSRYGDSPGVSDDTDECEPITLTVLWPNLRVFDIELQRVFAPTLTKSPPRIKVEGYKLLVRDNDGSFPSGDYSLVRLIPTGEKQLIVLEGEEDKELKSERWAAYSYGPEAEEPIPPISQPRFWQRTSVFLDAFGGKGRNTLPTSQDPAVQSFFTHATATMAGTDVFGLHLDTSLYISAIGFLLGSIALAMHAPLWALSRSRQQSIQPLFILFLPTIANGLLDRVLFTIGVTLTIAPLGIIYMQFQVFKFIYPAEFGYKVILLVLGVIGLIYSSLIFGILAFESASWRRRMGACTYPWTAR
jgi:hypothetical protein